MVEGVVHNVHYEFIVIQFISSKYEQPPRTARNQ